MSAIHVSTQWKSSTVFAGEEIECTITFENVSQAHNFPRIPSPSSQLLRGGPSRERWKETLQIRSTQGLASSNQRTSPSISGIPQTTSKTHKPSLSLSTSHRCPPVSMPSRSESVSKISSSANNKHRRSVSIVSIGGETIDEAPSRSPVLGSGRPIRGHLRAASLQVLPRRMINSNSGPQSAPGHDRAFTVPSPLLRSSSSLAEKRIDPQSVPRPKQFMGPDSELIPPTMMKQYRNSLAGFTFPQGPEDLDKAPGPFSSLQIGNPTDSLRLAVSPRSHDFTNGTGQPNPPTKMLSPASVTDTPRSSGEMYSMSNNSTETLASEYITRENSRLLPRPAHSRRGSSLVPTKGSKSEVLMMGYAQLTGSFTLDASLVNQNPFEGVRKKGIVGGQGGGGVVRSESAKRESGFLGSLSWGNIGDSFGGIIGSNEVSSIKEGKNPANARSIPILSTPQSVLFVDLQLEPGESKSYIYRHPLPKGIPPTHKGRALKVSYSLIVGTQRAAKVTHQHQMRHADIPFRVLSSVNEQGDILGHDLMSPHIILSNIGSVSSLQNPQHTSNASHGSPSSTKYHSSSPEFLSYVESLLERPHQNSGVSLLSPTDPDPRSSAILTKGSSTMKDSVDLAVLRSNSTSLSGRNVNRFELTRSGDRVATILLARPAYRLGETIPVVIDLTNSDVQCFSLHAALETFESIDPAIALRSKASIQRVTRRVHASQFEITIAAKRVLFNPMIPFTSTPDFVTSGINLEWRLRFEFVTNRIADSEEIDEDLADLLEVVARDERGIVKAAAQGLTCETFDVAVPLRVYGATPGFDEKTEPGEFPI